MNNYEYIYKILEGVNHKRCSKCREFKPLTNDYYKKANDTKYGFESQCRNCKHAPKYEHKHFNEDGLLYCSKCELFKESIEFYNDKNKLNRNKKCSFCKNCT